jgi:hypothetical protein
MTSSGPGPPSFSHVNSSTLMGNRAVGGTGGNSSGSVIFFANSITAGGSPTNCEPGSHVSASGSISSDGTCFNEASQENIDPKLGALADNGGPTDTHALLAGSPAIDHASTCNSPTPATDQRGVARPQGAACDIGSFELVPGGGSGGTTAGSGPGPGGTAAQGLPGSVIAALGLNHARFRAFGSGAAIARAKAPRGTTVTYTLTKAATVKFAVQRPVRGHKKGGKCVTKRGVRGKRCTTFKTAGGFRHRGVAGQNHFLFRGRLHRRALKPGGYRLVANAAGATLTVKFRIVR